MDDEKQVLFNSLSVQRAHVLGVVRALSDEQLRQPALPSGWNCVGMVNHLSIDVERFWFREVMADEPGVGNEFRSESGSAWDVDPGEAPEKVIASYEAEIERADLIIGSTALDAEPAGWPTDMFGSFRLHNLRELMLHVITETACHAGHLDAARELFNGGQWLVL
jgi:uncharacterized damage-inducible protein DinB